MKRVYLLLLVVVTSSMLMPISGQESVFVGVNFDTFFDNREYSQGSGATSESFDDDSGTLFASRFTPFVRYNWSEVNNLVVGCELIENFGLVDSKFVASTLPLIYYKYESEGVRAASGIFTRDLIHEESYSRAFFSGDYLFNNNLLSGFMGSYSAGASFVELVIDWEGMRSELSREKFRLLSAGRHYFGDLYYGYAATLFHYAKQDDGVHTNIVDYSALNMMVGYNYSGALDVNCKVGAFITAQRDRAEGEASWQTPAMAELMVELKYNGLFISNELYLGKSVNPFFDGEGYELYTNECFFRGEGGVYNRTAFGYANSFFDDSVTINSAVALHYDGYAVASQYIVDVGVKLQKRVYKSNKNN